MRSLRNFKMEEPHAHAIYYLSMLMFYSQWTKDELIDALEGKLQTIVRYVNDLNS